MSSVDEVGINVGAPFVLRGEQEIAADVETVWGLLARIEEWPRWNPDVKSAQLEGELAPGTVFRWRAGGASLVSRLIAVDPPREIAWTGKGPGMKVVHVYRLEPRDAGTVVRTEESVEGIVARLLKGWLRKRMDTAVQAGLRSLAQAAEAAA